MSNTIFIKQGSKLRISNSNVCIEVEEDKVLIPFHEIEIIVVENLMCSLTAGVIVECSKNNIPIIFCDSKHTPATTTNSLYTYYKQTQRIQEQVLWSESRKEKLFVKIIKQKILNQLRLIEFLSEGKNSNDFKGVLNSINRENYLSMEAETAKLHFKKIFGNEFRRHSKDKTNYLLNYGYALLRSKIRQTIVSKGLHPSLGIVHNNQFNNYNLSDDVIEVYRCIVDYYVYIIVKSDFELEESKDILQDIIYQNVIFNGIETSLIRSIELFIDEIIEYMNRNNPDVEIPYLEVYLYELQI